MIVEFPLWGDAMPKLLEVVLIPQQVINGEVTSGPFQILNSTTATFIRLRFPVSQECFLDPACQGVVELHTSPLTGTESLKKWTRINRTPFVGAPDNGELVVPGFSGPIDPYKNRYVHAFADCIGLETQVSIELWDTDPSIPTEGG